MWLVFGQEETGGSLDLVGRGRKLGTVAVAFKFESLIVDSVRDTSHFLRSPSSLFSCPQQSHEKA